MSRKEEPPDKYQCIKVPIKSILKNETKTLERINDAVMRTNYITTKSYFLLRLWVLQKYHNNQDIPHITEDTIKMSMKSLMKASSGPKAKGNNLLLLQEFKQLHTFSLEDGKNLSAILDYYTTTMITAIENNIKINFIDYVKRFVNSYFKSINKDEIQNKYFRKQLYKELQLVKNDIINETLTSDPKYHSWLHKNRYKIVPQEYDTSYYYDVKVNPQRYLKYMIFMNLQLEEKEAKMFQFFPLQTQLIPRHIQIDTKSIIELLVDTDKKYYFNNVELNKEILWDNFFNIKQKLRKYDFDYTIITDGYSVSLRFLHKEFVNEERIKKDKMKNSKKSLNGLTDEEKEIKKQEKITIQNKIKEENKKKRLLQSKQKKETKKEIQHEFPYIDEVSKELLDGKHIYIDPGKRSLLTIMNDDGDFLSYTNKQLIHETKRLKYQALLKNYKDKIDITTKENALSIFNSKTCSLEKFKEYIYYIKRKNSVNTNGMLI
jgi:NADH:ubiquinone oxidoreductase subunit